MGRRGFGPSLVLITFVTLAMMGIAVAPAEASCESCQYRLAAGWVCFYDSEGWTMCNDTGPGCADDEIGGSTKCDGDEGGGGGGGGGDECNTSGYGDVSCMSCDPNAT